MRRYIPKPAQSLASDDYWWRSSDEAWDDMGSDSPNVTVFEPERSSFSGLYDAEGNELHVEREPMGFRLKR